MTFCMFFFFFFNDTATTEIYTLSLHDALPIASHRIRADRRTGRSDPAGAPIVRARNQAYNRHIGRSACPERRLGGRQRGVGIGRRLCDEEFLARALRRRTAAGRVAVLPERELPRSVRGCGIPRQDRVGVVGRREGGGRRAW